MLTIEKNNKLYYITIMFANSHVTKDSHPEYILKILQINWKQKQMTK